MFEYVVPCHICHVRPTRDAAFCTLSHCAFESCPTPGDNRGSTSPFGSISGVSYHAVNGRSFYVVQIVQPSCYWPSLPSLPTRLPGRHAIVQSAFLSHHMSKYLKAACATLESSVRYGWMFSSPHTLVCLSIHETLITRLQYHISNASTFFLSAFLIVQVSAPYSILSGTPRP